MNPVQLLLGTILAIAGGAGGSFLVSRMQQSQTRTGDAFDDTTTALMLTPAAPYAAAAKTMRPFAERATTAIVREFAPKKKKKVVDKKQETECHCEEKAMRNEAGFTSVGAVPQPPPKPARFFRSATTVNGKKVFKNWPKPEALYNKEIAEWKKAYAAWEQARAFDQKIEREKAAAAEQIRRNAAQAELDALLKKAQGASATAQPKPVTLKFGKEFVDEYRKKVASGQLQPSNAPELAYPNAYGQQPTAYPYPPELAYPNAYGQQPTAYPYPPELAYPNAYPPEFASTPEVVEVPNEPTYAVDPFALGDMSDLVTLDGMYGIEESSDVGAWDELAPDADSFEQLEGLDDVDVGNADAACCVSCGVGLPCEGGSCG